jgi:AraC-like DNA-binding protein
LLVDLLAAALSAIHFKSTVYCQSEFTAPFAVEWERRDGYAGFFMVVRGGCLLQVESRDVPISLAPGDFVMSPRFMGYTLRDSLQTNPVVPFDSTVGSVALPASHRIVRWGGGGTATKLIMGCFNIDVGSTNPLLQSLPDFIYVRSEELQAEPWLEATLKFLASECMNEKPGSSIAIARLTDVLFVQALRFHIAQQGGDNTGWLKAIADPQIGKALTLIHSNPESPWTVASLASAVDMSRSSFATKFSTMTKNTPLDYVTAWRMHKAKKLLTQGSESIIEIALQVGYQSEASFNKAFKREFGQPPGIYRRRATLVS